MENIGSSVISTDYEINRQKKCIDFTIKLDDNGIEEALNRSALPFNGTFEEMKKQGLDIDDITFLFQSDGQSQKAVMTVIHKDLGKSKIELSDDEAKFIQNIGENAVRQDESHPYVFEIGNKAVIFEANKDYKAVLDAVEEYKVADIIDKFNSTLKLDDTNIYEATLTKKDIVTNEKIIYRAKLEELVDKAKQIIYAEMNQGYDEIPFGYEDYDDPDIFEQLQAADEEYQRGMLNCMGKDENKRLEIYDNYKRDWIAEHIDDITMTATMALYENSEEAENMTFDEYVEEYGFDGGQIYSSYEEFISEDLDNYTTWKDKLELSETGSIYFNYFDTNGDPVPVCTVTLEKDTNTALIHFEIDDGPDVILDLNNEDEIKEFEDTLDYYVQERDWGFSTEYYADDAEQDYIKSLGSADITFVDIDDMLLVDAFRDKIEPALNVPIELTDEMLDNILERINFLENYKNTTNFNEALQNKNCVKMEATISENNVYFEALIVEPIDNLSVYSQLVPLGEYEQNAVKDEVNRYIKQVYNKDIDQTIKEYVIDRNEESVHHLDSTDKKKVDISLE